MEIKKSFPSQNIGFIGIIIGILSILISVYIYYLSKETRNFTYFINNSKALVVDSKRASNMQVIYNNKIISSDIVAIQFAVWNYGKQSIKKANILKDIEIKSSDSIKILEASIRKTSRKVTKFTIINNDFVNGIIHLDWDILEHNDGAVIQILYTGKLDASFFIDGIIEGQSSINQIIYNDFNDKNPPLLAILGGLFLFTICYYFIYINGRTKEIFKLSNSFTKKMIKGRYLVLILMLYLPIALVLMGIIQLIFAPPSVPFGF